VGKLAKTKVDITKHSLIPKHSKLNEKEKKVLRKKYTIIKAEKDVAPAIHRKI